MKLTDAVKRAFRWAFGRLGVNTAVLPQLEEMRGRLAEVVTTLAISEALHEGAIDRLRLLRSSSRAPEWQDEIAAMAAAVQGCEEDLRRGRAKLEKALDYYAAVRAAAGASRLASLDPPTVTDALRQRARLFVSEQLDSPDLPGSTVIQSLRPQ